MSAPRGAAPDYAIRPFQTAEEYLDCIELQRETWGDAVTVTVSPAILKVAQILGGIAAGAYDASGRLAGFVFGITGLRDGEVVHWSDMLAVRAGVRDAGLGTRLKAYQRERMLALGIEKMHWTFDPLQSRNAHVNFNKLGIVSREYAQDMYGEGDSPLHRGIGTDRFIALWLLSSERVRTRLDAAVAAGRGGHPSTEAEGEVEHGAPRAAAGPGRPVARPIPLALDALPGAGHPRPGTPRLDLDEVAVGVTIPSDIVALMADDMGLARAWREATRTAFTHYLARGYEAREFARGDPASTYRLERDAVSTPTTGDR